MEDDDVSNVFCAADTFMAIFGLRRCNEITNEIANGITNEISETMEPLALEEQDEGHES